MRQSYARFGKFVLISHQRSAHAKQCKRANRALKTFRTPLGRVIRDVRRKIAGLRIFTSGQKRGITEQIKRELRQCSAVKPVIGHLKAEHRMGQNHLAGRAGDAANAILAAVGYNFSLLLKWLITLLRAWSVVLTFFKITKNSMPYLATKARRQKPDYRGLAEKPHVCHAARLASPARLPSPYTILAGTNPFNDNNIGLAYFGLQILARNIEGDGPDFKDLKHRHAAGLRRTPEKHAGSTVFADHVRLDALRPDTQAACEMNAKAETVEKHTGGENPAVLGKMPDDIDRGSAGPVNTRISTAGAALILHSVFLSLQ